MIETSYISTPAEPIRTSVRCSRQLSPAGVLFYEVPLMSNPWFRLYHSLLDNPKVQRLEPELFKAWINILCAASRKEGDIPDVEDLAFMLRISLSDCKMIVNYLISAKLIDKKDGKLVPHDWDELQFTSDTSRNRTRAYRDRMKASQEKRNGDVTVTSHVTTQEQNRTDTEQNRVCESEPHTREQQIREFDYQQKSRFVPEDFQPNESFHSTHRHRNPAANYHVELARFKAHEFQVGKSDWQRAWQSWWMRAKPDTENDTRNSLERQTDELLGIDRRYT